jgi:hypothetical protein
MELSGQYHNPYRFSLGTHWIRGWVGFRAAVDFSEKTKNSTSAGIQTPDRPTCSLVAKQTTLSRHRTVINMKST